MKKIPVPGFTKTKFMKTTLPFFIIALVLISFSACQRKVYTSASFEQQTLDHKKVAILPAQIIFTGKLPKDMRQEDIEAIEERESIAFQHSLYNSILRHANSKKYFTTVNFQHTGSTLQVLEKNNISVRDSWNMNDREIARLLGVDAVVRLRIQKQRYMSDMASYGISLGSQIITKIGGTGGLPLPVAHNKTNDIITSCTLVSDDQTLWNDSYTGASDWNTPGDEVVNNITDNYGKRFPYKKRY